MLCIAFGSRLVGTETSSSLGDKESHVVTGTSPFSDLMQQESGCSTLFSTLWHCRDQSQHGMSELQVIFVGAIRFFCIVISKMSL